MTIRVAVCVVAAVLCGGVPDAGAKTIKLTMEQAVDMALKRRGDLRAAKMDIKVAAAKNSEVNARFLPEITGNATANIGLAGSFQGFGMIGLSMSPYKDLIGGSVDAVWEVFDFGRTVAESAAASHEITSSKHRAADIERRIRFRTADLYLACLALKARAELAKKRLASAEKGNEIAEHHARAQIIAKADADMAALQLLQARREKLDAERAEHACEVHLAGYVGTHDDIEIADVTMRKTPPTAAAAKLIAAAHKSRPDLRARRQQAAAWDSRAKAAGLDNLPKVRAVGSLGWALLNHNAAARIMDWPLDHHFYAVGVGVQVPIFEGGAMLARLRGHQARRDAEKARAADLERKITAEVREAVQAIRVAYAQFEAASRETERADKVEATAEKRFKAGLSNMHAWTTAHELAFRSRIALQNARYRVLRAHIAVEFVVGSPNRAQAGRRQGSRKGREFGLRDVVRSRCAWPTPTGTVPPESARMPLQSRNVRFRPK